MRYDNKCNHDLAVVRNLMYIFLKWQKFPMISVFFYFPQVNKFRAKTRIRAYIYSVFIWGIFSWSFLTFQLLQIGHRTLYDPRVVWRLDEGVPANPRDCSLGTLNILYNPRKLWTTILSKRVSDCNRLCFYSTINDLICRKLIFINALFSINNLNCLY